MDAGFATGRRTPVVIPADAGIWWMPDSLRVVVHLSSFPRMRESSGFVSDPCSHPRGCENLTGSRPTRVHTDARAPPLRRKRDSIHRTEPH